MDRGCSTYIARLVVRSLTSSWLAALLTAVAALSPNNSRATSVRNPIAVFAPVLIYHHVKPLKASDNAIERGLTVLPSQFDRQIRYLVSHRFSLVTARQLSAYLSRRAALPHRPVVLTFDDGYSDVYANVYKFLLRLHLRATFFIVPGFLNTPRYLTWTQVVDMSNHGMDMEGHSMTHPDLTTLSVQSVQWQVTQSRRELQTRLHRVVSMFAYPYGAYSPTVVNAVRQAGYQTAFTTHEGWSAESAHRLTEPRVYVDIDDSLQIFVGRLLDNSAVLAQDPT